MARNHVEDPLEFERHIAETIRNYWLAKGHAITTKVDKVEYEPGRPGATKNNDRGVYFKVVSDMVGGLPRSHGR